MRRVWTLQEALLTKPHKLYWQFAQEALNGTQLWKVSNLNEIQSPLALYTKSRYPNRISYRESAFHRRLPMSQTNARDPQVLRTNLMEVMYALRYRSLSHIEDEMICIAPMLGFNRSEILRSKDHEERVHTFLSLWKEIPSYLVFTEGERISKPGRRWMPSSFVRGNHKSVTLRAPLQLAKFDSKGIYITYPGLRISCPEKDSWIHFDTGFRNPLEDHWYMVKDQGMIFESLLPEDQRWRY